MVKKIRRESKKLWNNVFGVGTIGLAMFFSWMILQGAINLFPEVTGTTLIVIGVAGLSIMGYLGWKNIG